MGGNQSKKMIDLDTTCAQVLQDEESGVKVGGFCGYNFVIDNQRDVTSLYHIGKKLGQGSYACVYKCINKSTDKIHAMKIINKRNCSNLDRIMLEISVMKRIDHMSVARIYETFEDKMNVYIVMEICEGGDLFERIQRFKRFSELQSASVMEQMFRLFTYMWEKDMVHRDVKPENFMFLEANLPVEKSSLKMIDFGFARRAEEGKLMHTKCGTPYYVSPQMLSSVYDRFTDMWSCGIILYVLLCGYPPFYGGDTAEVLAKIQLGRYSFFENDWRYVARSAKDLIRNLLYIMPSERLTPAEALQHPFIQENKAKHERITMKLSVIDNLRKFCTHNALKKAALQVIAAYVDVRLFKASKDLFLQMDVSGDGQISSVELRRELEASGHDVPEDLDEIMSQVDSDGSGVISWTEYLASTMDKRDYSEEDLVWAAFRAFDRNGDGVISKQEIVEILTLGDLEDHEERSHFVELVMADVDEDGSGAIDFYEFLAIMRSDKKAGSGQFGRKRIISEHHRKSVVGAGGRKMAK